MRPVNSGAYRTLALAFAFLVAIIFVLFGHDPRGEIQWKQHTEFSATAAALASPSLTQLPPHIHALKLNPITSVPPQQIAPLPEINKTAGTGGRSGGISDPTLTTSAAADRGKDTPGAMSTTVDSNAQIQREAASSINGAVGNRNMPGLVPQQRASAAVSQHAVSEEQFITIGKDGNFMNGCRTFFPAGWNQYEVVEAAAGGTTLYGATLPANKTGPQMIRDIMDMAVADNLNMLRTFAFATNALYPMQTSPGVYNEAIFQGLDYVLDQARQRGIKVILALINNWEKTGSVEEVVQWAGLQEHEQFFTEPACKATYKSSAAAIIGRVNSINGRQYRDDPTIMAWNLMNEPRCFKCNNGQLHSWFVEMAAYVKSLDPNHLLSTGEEGFYAGTGPNAYANPATASNTLDGWPGLVGQDFPADLRIPEIDFGTVHSWVDNWFDVSEPFQKLWIQKHIHDAAEIGKPILLEEFGKFPVNRDAYFRNMYDAVLTSAKRGAPLKGAAFWQWYDDGQFGTEEEGGGSGYFGIRHGDSTFKLIRDNAAAMRNLSTVVSGCRTTPAALAPVSDCSATWVDGQPGTGLEGPQCDIDINECVRGYAHCAAEAGCVNAYGSFQCICHVGHVGDGESKCTPRANLSTELREMYATAGPGWIACSEGDDVEYPQGAPGFEHDPTGSRGMKAIYGNAANVTAMQCQIACEMAPTCDSISYNPTTQACYPKRGSSLTDCNAAQKVCNDGKLTDSCSKWQSYRKIVVSDNE